MGDGEPRLARPTVAGGAGAGWVGEGVPECDNRIPGSPGVVDVPGLRSTAGQGWPGFGFDTRGGGTYIRLVPEFNMEISV